MPEYHIWGIQNQQNFLCLLILKAGKAKSSIETLQRATKYKYAGDGENRPVPQQPVPEGPAPC